MGLTFPVRIGSDRRAAVLTEIRREKHGEGEDSCGDDE
jgi:hypothetical protein